MKGVWVERRVRREVGMGRMMSHWFKEVVGYAVVTSGAAASLVGECAMHATQFRCHMLPYGRIKWR
jgi:hypothetical protein